MNIFSAYFPAAGKSLEEEELRQLELPGNARKRGERGTEVGLGRDSGAEYAAELYASWKLIRETK